MIIKIVKMLLLLLMPFIMLGIIKKTKAFWSGRKGISIFQPIYDFSKLLKKEPVYSETTSFIFKLAPSIILTSAIFSGFFVPIIGIEFLINIDFSFVIFAYILGIGKFFALLSAMDTGSSFEGMGASREACFTTLVEPGFFIITASLCAMNHINTFESFRQFVTDLPLITKICVIVLAITALFIMILIECSRIPTDDPATHLELTMIHEVMILDNSGCDLAFIMWASGIKMLIISTLIASLIIPAVIPQYLTILLYILILIIISVIIGTIESGMARLRMSHVYEFVFVMVAIALIILALVTMKVFGT